MTTPGAEKVVSLADRPQRRDWHDTLVPDGIYQVAFVRERRSRRFKRITWDCTFTIVDEGEHHGLPLYFPLDVRSEGRVLSPLCAFVEAYLVGSGGGRRRLPANLWQWRPSRFLKSCLFLAQLRKVTRSPRGHDRPEGQHYSRIARLVERFAGTPPCMRSEPQA